MIGLRQLFGMLWNGTEARSTLSNPDMALMDAFGSYRNPSGKSMTPVSAMQLSTVYACVRVIAEAIGSLPVHIYRRGTKERVDDLPEARLLHVEPNQRMTSAVWRETWMVHTLLLGNGVNIILRDGGGVPRELLPVDWGSVQIRLTATGELAYQFNLDGSLYTVSQWDVLHLPGLSFNGVLGISPVRYAAQSMGLASAAEEYGARFFGSGSSPSGFITVPGTLTKDQADTLRSSWLSTYSGISNAMKTAVLFDGAKWERISIPPEEAQFLETRKFQVTEICRWFRVPPHMVMDLERATFSNIEHQSLQFVMHTLRPWLVRMEQEINRKLFPSSIDGRPGEYMCEFNVEGLLRGDIASRSDYYVKGRQWGWLSANDIRSFETMPPIEGGDTYLEPLNMVPAGRQQDTQGGGNVGTQ